MNRNALAERLRAVRGEFPRAFWVLVGGTVVFNLAIAVGMPYETLYLTQERGFSVASVGLVWTLSAFAGLPMQIVGGMAADWRGRKPVLALAAFTIVVFYAVLAAASALWQVAVVAIVEACFGWPLYLVACNAMIADLVPFARRSIAYSVWRAGINAGVIGGPLIAAVLVAAGASYRYLFVVASLGCAVFFVLALVAVRETKPVPVAGGEDDAQVPLWRGLGVVFATRRFLVFSLVALLPLVVMGQFLWILPVYLVDDLHMKAGAWGLLLALTGFVVLVSGPPLVHRLRNCDHGLVMALAAALVAIGVGGAAFVAGGWPIVGLVIVFSLGEALFWPISSTAVAEMAPAALRGTFMGAWTLVDCAGRGLGPVLGGWTMGRLGGRRAFAITLAIGLTGAALFAALCRGLPRQSAANEPSGDEAAETLVAAPQRPTP